MRLDEPYLARHDHRIKEIANADPLEGAADGFSTRVVRDEPHSEPLAKRCKKLKGPLLYGDRLDEKILEQAITFRHQFGRELPPVSIGISKHDRHLLKGRELAEGRRIPGQGQGACLVERSSKDRELDGANEAGEAAGQAPPDEVELAPIELDDRVSVVKEAGFKRAHGSALPAKTGSRRRPSP